MNFDAFIERTADLLINPSKEWARIQAEGTQDPQQLQHYLLNRIAPAILLNISTYFIGAVFIGAKIKGATEGVYLTPTTAFFASILLASTYVGIIYMGAGIIRLIAASFNSEADTFNSLKLAAFSLYPLLVIGSLHIIPSIRIGTIAGSYGIYLLYTGFPVLLGTPVEKSAGFTLVVSLAMIGMLALAFSLINAISGADPLLRMGL